MYNTIYSDDREKAQGNYSNFEINENYGLWAEAHKHCYRSDYFCKSYFCPIQGQERRRALSNQIQRALIRYRQFSSFSVHAKHLKTGKTMFMYLKNLKRSYQRPTACGWIFGIRNWVNGEEHVHFCLCGGEATYLYCTNSSIFVYTQKYFELPKEYDFGWKEQTTIEGFCTYTLRCGQADMKMNEYPPFCKPAPQIYIGIKNPNRRIRKKKSPHYIYLSL